MRALLPLALLLAAALAPGMGPLPAVAQGAPPSAAVLLDREGDVVVTSGPASSPAGTPANPQTASADLRELDALEGDTDWTFVLKPASLAQQGGSLNAWNVTFSWMDAPFEVALLRSRVDPTSSPLTRATLNLCDKAPCHRVTELEHKLDEAGGTFTFLVPKRYVTSLQGHAPVFGSELTNLTVRSVVSFDGFPGAPATSTRAEDRMPDAGAGKLVYAKGGQSNGAIVLEAPDPVRVSNGGATTFVFVCHVQNRGEKDDTVLLGIEGLPQSWTSSVQGTTRVAAGAEKPVFTIVTVPFEHVHGGFSSFNLTAQSSNDPSVKASLKFGVLHTPVPMPAGHHSELYLHAAPADSGVFQATFPRTDNTMNTLAEHGPDAAESLASTFNGVSWRIPLAPQLQMGLDMDVARTGALAASIVGHVAQPTGADVTTELWLTKGDEDVAKLGEFAKAKVTLDPQAPAPLKLTFTPSAAGDYVAYRPGQNLELRVLAKLDGSAPTNPQSPPGLVVKDFKLVLPLNEYHDAPTFEEGESTTIKLDVLGPLEKTGRPGTTMTFAFRATNQGAGADQFEATLSGTDALKSSLEPTPRFRLDKGASQELTLGVRIPADAGNDERLETVLVVRSVTDPSSIAIARTATLVSRTAAADDEQAILDAAKGGKAAPGLDVASAAAAVTIATLVALARRGSRGS